MGIHDSDFLKNWREKLGVSQKRFAELAKISLTTLRQFEIGSHKPQRKTLKKLNEVMQGIEAGNLGEEAIRPPRKRRKDAKIKLDVEASNIISGANLGPTKRRGRPPKLQNSTETLAVPEALPASSDPVPTPKQNSAPLPTSAQTAPSSIGVIQLSNLDLELINRVLNMSGKEKLALLAQLM